MSETINDAKFFASTIAGYQPSDQDVASDPQYYGFLKRDGQYYIMEQNIASGTFRYYFNKDEDLVYETAWTGRAALSYGYWHDVV